ncbi:MAG: fibronectin type III domain-containing protein [Chloroflexota bacterium]
MRRVRLVLRAAVGAAILISSLGPSGAAGSPPPTVHGAVVSAAVHHDESGPLREAGPRSPSAANLRERPLKLVGPGSGPNTPDGATQLTSGGPLTAAGGPGFAGIGNGDYGFSPAYAPPDTVGAVGASQYVQWVNVDLAVFDKSGTIAPGFPKSGKALWAGFGGACEANNDGDPIVEYDKIANRWILTQFSVATTPYLQCVAVSTTSDATGSYYRYAFSYGSTLFNDYPKLSVWPDAYYITFNMFTSTFQGANVCAYDRSSMLTGAPATQQCFQLSSAYGGLLPADLDGSTLPPTGAPNPILNFGANALNLWRFHVDWAAPSSTSLQGPISIPVASFARACNGSNCIPQPGTRQKLDSLGDRLMYRLAYRRFAADGHESLVVNHSVAVGGGLFNSGVSSVRWYELRNASGSTIGSGTPVVYQQGTLGTADGVHRWMASGAMDQAGDIALGYSAANASVYPSIRYTGRTPSDPLNTMETETVAKAGSGSQLQNLSRWGDYSAMTVDPVDDCTFWYTTEYLKSSGTWNWSTWITSFRFPNCGSTVAPDFTISASPAAQTVTAGANGQYTVTVVPTGGAEPVALSATGVPAGGLGSFSQNPTSSSSVLTITTSGSTTPGSYPITISGTSSGVTHTTSVDLVVTAPSTATAPSEPQSVTANPAKGKGVQVSWSAPANDGGSAVTGYRVYRGTTAASLTFLVATANVTGYKDASTIRGTSYYYAVSAVNTVGESPRSAVAGPVVAR